MSKQDEKDIERIGNHLFLESTKYKMLLEKILTDVNERETRVSNCIELEKQKIKKRHPEWTSEMIHKKAQNACGQKPSVQIEEKEKKYDETDPCVSRKISIFAKEHPKWEQKQVVAAAINYCGQSKKDSDNMECISSNMKRLDKNHPDWSPEKIIETAEEQCYKNKMDSGAILDTFKFIKDNLSSTLKFEDYISMMGYNAALEDKAICYKMDNVQETDTEYIVSVVLAAAMTQPYPSKGLIMAKRPESLAKIRSVDYITGNLITKLPTFEFHPEKEKRENENGYVTDIRYQPNKERVVGLLHVIKKKLSDNLRGYFERRERIHVSIGFMYTEGPGGVFKASKDNKWNGKSYDASQENILLTHLALLPPNLSRGRCPLPYCGVGLKINDSISLDIDTIKISIDSLTEENPITDADGVIEVVGDLYIKNKDGIFGIVDALRTQDTEIKNLKKTLKKYFIQLAQALNR